MQFTSIKTDPNRANSVIGGLFGLESALPDGRLTASFLTGREVFLVNARSGIWLLVNRLRPPQVWVPSYLCHTILGAIDQNAAALRFYEVDCDLKIRSNEWISDVAPGDLVIFIDYFGFPSDQEAAIQVKEKGAWVLEDACQALLASHAGTVSDFVLFSPRKWIGVPDGGILRFPANFHLTGICLESPPMIWWLKGLQGTILRREFDDGLPVREWFKIFSEVDDAAPTGPYGVSQLSQAIIQYSVDYSTIAKKRIDNYRTLLDGLAGYAIFPEIGRDVVPLGFPVRVAHRDAVRQALFDYQIYPPIHWLIDGVVPPEYEDSHRLAHEIMTLPCDQRCGPEDMERIAEVFLESVAQHK